MCLTAQAQRSPQNARTSPVAALFSGRNARTFLRARFMPDTLRPDPAGDPSKHWEAPAEGTSRQPGPVAQRQPESLRAVHESKVGRLAVEGILSKVLVDPVAPFPER